MSLFDSQQDGNQTTMPRLGKDARNNPQDGPKRAALGVITNRVKPNSLYNQDQDGLKKMENIEEMFNTLPVEFIVCDKPTGGTTYLYSWADDVDKEKIQGSVKTSGRKQPRAAGINVIPARDADEEVIERLVNIMNEPVDESDFQCQDENACAKKTSKPLGLQPCQFVVFDETTSTAQSKPLKEIELYSSVELTDAVTALPQSTRVPLADVPVSPDFICLDTTGSPMVLDISSENNIPIESEAVILTLPEYAEDIYAYLKEVECRMRAIPGYMKKQQDITSSMRSILVNWLVEVADEYQLHRETLFLAVNYIDRFLSKISVLQGKLQLVGTTCMFLASKYEEIYPPNVSDFAFITHNTYNKQQILRLEKIILKVLNFNVTVPTTHWFCEDFVKSCCGDNELKSLTMFLAELTLLEVDTYLNYLPSITAAACLCLARYTLGLHPWPQCLINKTGYDVGDFLECLQDLHQIYLGAETHPEQAIQEKYRHDRFQNVSNFSRNPVPRSLAPLIV